MANSVSKQTIFSRFMTNTWLVLATGVVSGLFGSGAMWSCLQLRLDREKHELETVKQQDNLRRAINERLFQAIELGTNLYQHEEYEQNRRRLRVKMLMEDVVSLEQKLAILESREPREIPVPLPADPVRNFRIE
jgi:hypothetical protein